MCRTPCQGCSDLMIKRCPAPAAAVTCSSSRKQGAVSALPVLQCHGALSCQRHHIGMAILADEVLGHSLGVHSRQGPEAAVLLGGILQRPPEPDDRGRVCSQKCAVLVRPYLAAYLGLLQCHTHSSVTHCLASENMTIPCDQRAATQLVLSACMTQWAWQSATELVNIKGNWRIYLEDVHALHWQRPLDAERLQDCCNLL